MLSISRIFFSLLCVSNVLCASESCVKDQDGNKKILYPTQATEESKEEIKNVLQQQATIPTTDILFSEKEIAEMEMVFAASPKKAQQIVKHLQDPNYFRGDLNYRAAYFVGTGGNEQMILAKVITHKAAPFGWKSKFISSSSFSKEYRNQTAIELRDELNKIESSNEPTIIIIEDLNKLFENGHYQYDDADMTGAVLSAFLDKNKRNKNLFLIGTMPCARQLPNRIKDRMILGFIALK